MRGRNSDKRWIGQTGTVGDVLYSDMILVNVDGQSRAVFLVAFFSDELESANGLAQAIKRLEAKHEI